jgi:hypothetical protein
MKFILFAFIALLYTAPVVADPVFITENGAITVTGRIDDVDSYDNSFTLSHDNEEIEVTMDMENGDMFDTLSDNDIIKDGSFVTVTGELEEGVYGLVINASAINLYQ